MKRNAHGVLLCASAIAFMVLPAWAHGSDETQIANASQLKLGPVPNAPACVTAASEHGDPSKGASTMLLKFTSGCTVPMHWHTPNEEVMMVSGSAKLQLPDGTTLMLEKGGFARLPAKHPHQFACVTACTTFLVSDGVFDVHYVDNNGNEIPAEQALSTTKPSAKIPGKKKGM
jgi:quercetin dioxygenase-like cupin family protein